MCQGNHNSRSKLSWNASRSSYLRIVLINVRTWYTLLNTIGMDLISEIGGYFLKSIEYSPSFLSGNELMIMRWNKTVSYRKWNIWNFTTFRDYNTRYQVIVNVCVSYVSGSNLFRMFFSVDILPMIKNAINHNRRLDSRELFRLIILFLAVAIQCPLFLSFRWQRILAGNQSQVISNNLLFWITLRIMNPFRIFYRILWKFYFYKVYINTIWDVTFTGIDTVTGATLSPPPFW